MKVIVVGAGAVGLHLAKTLSWEGHEVVLIDHIPELVDRAGGRLDVMAIRGSGTSISTLEKAGAKDADLLVAVTSIDEVNIVACMLAKQLGVRNRIARIRNQEFSKPDSRIRLDDLGIDQVIHPELEAAREVVKLVRYQHALEVVECAGGKVLLLGFKVEPTSRILGIPLKTLAAEQPELGIRVVAISRLGQTLLPGGNDAVQADDKVFVAAKPDDVPTVFSLAGKPEKTSRDVMILGGGMIGRIAAELLEADRSYNLKLIESNPQNVQRASNRLSSTMVVQSGSQVDFDVLAVEGLADMGVFAALTDDDENNIVTSLFARHLRVGRTITLISKPEYMPVVRAIGLDAAINVKIITSDAVHKYLLGGRILEVSSLTGVDAEILEFSVNPKSRAAGKLIREVKFPEGSIVAAVEHQGEVFVAVGETPIQAGDRVVTFARPASVSKLKKLLE